MDNFSMLLVIVITGLVIVAITILISLSKKVNTQNEAKEWDLLAETLKSLKDDLKMDIRETRRELDQKIYTGQKDMSENVKYQFEASQKLIKDINQHLGEVKESVVEVKEGSKQVISMTEQLSNLEKVLTNQKTRGNWGEASLELLLANYLAGQYEMQKRYKNGEIVDAVIRMKNKILPIDSKFSMDNYRRALDAKTEEDQKYFADEFKKDIKKRIEETSKYINETEENTTPFAFMYIPSEAIYYDINAGQNGALKVETEKLLDFAKSKRVHLVSPSSIFAFIHLIWTGIKDQKIEENTKEIKKKIEELGKHIHKFEEYIQKLGASLNTTVNHYNTGYREFKKIDKDIYKITDGKSELSIDPVMLDKANLED